MLNILNFHLELATIMESQTTIIEWSKSHKDYFMVFLMLAWLLYLKSPR